MVRHAEGTEEVPARPIPPPMRVNMPCHGDEKGLEDFAGRIRFRRRFGYPGRIDAHERVWLTFEGLSGTAEVWLNGRRLGRSKKSENPFEFEITELLQMRNELVVQIDAPEGSRGWCGEVALEVRCTAFLRAVRAWAADEGQFITLHVVGEVVGTAERLLELYVLLDGATQNYTTVEPTSGGLPFHVRVEGFRKEQCLPGGEHVVRVDLVSGASLWYVVECMLASGAA
jgi:hypothetical protein